LDGEHLGKPNLLVEDLLKSRPQEKSGSLVGKHYGELFLFKVVMVFDVVGESGYEGGRHGSGKWKVESGEWKVRRNY
jgi:hypothetical protein